MYFDKILQANVVDRRENKNVGGWSFIVDIHYDRHFYSKREIKEMVIPEGKTKFIVDTLDETIDLQNALLYMRKCDIGGMGRPEEELKIQTKLFE